jgi:hypothetical protein
LTIEEVLVNVVDNTYVTIVLFNVNARNCSALLRIKLALEFDQPLPQWTK